MASFSCHKIAGGKAAGEMIYSKDPVCFYLIDPKTGQVIEKQHSSCVVCIHHYRPACS